MESDIPFSREKLREQHALGEEIAQAITSAPIGEPIDETELDDELAELEQEQLDNKMLKTGTVPVSDEIHRLPAAANGESKLHYLECYTPLLTLEQSKARPLYMLRRKMKRKSFGNYKLRWPCNVRRVLWSPLVLSNLRAHIRRVWDLHVAKGFGIPHYAFEIPDPHFEPAF